jgi:hypothetical protein
MAGGKRILAPADSGIGSTRSSLGKRLAVRAKGEGNVNRVEKHFAIRYPPLIRSRR